MIGVTGINVFNQVVNMNWLYDTIQDDIIQNMTFQISQIRYYIFCETIDILFVYCYQDSFFKGSTLKGY